MGLEFWRTNKYLKIYLTSEMNSMFNVRNIEFSRYYIFFGIFIKHISTPCNTWRDVTVACYLYTVKITVCKNSTFTWLIKSAKNELKRGYSVVWRWILNLFHEWGRIFHIFTSLLKILSNEWNKFHIQRQKQRHFCLLHFLWSFNLFLTLHAITWRDPVFRGWKCNKYVDTLKKNFISIQNYMYRNNLTKYDTEHLRVG